MRLKKYCNNTRTLQSYTQREVAGPPEIACREWSAQNPPLFTIFFTAQARFLRAIVRRPFYSGLIKEPRGEPKIRNASGI